MTDGNLNARDEKLVQWLREAHAKESELEAALEQHIGLTEKMAYKKRLRSHLTETRDHKRRVAQRIKQIGGTLDDGPLPTPISAAAGKTLAAIKGQVGALHAAVSDQAETHLRNAQEELREEHAEIALYSRIEAFALEVGDGDTAKLAAGIRRDETRMAKYLDAELPRLVGRSSGRGTAGAAPQAAGSPFTHAQTATTRATTRSRWRNARAKGGLGSERPLRSERSPAPWSPSTIGGWPPDPATHPSDPANARRCETARDRYQWGFTAQTPEPVADPGPSRIRFPAGAVRSDARRRQSRALAFTGFRWRS